MSLTKKQLKKKLEEIMTGYWDISPDEMDKLMPNLTTKQQVQIIKAVRLKFNESIYPQKINQLLDFIEQELLGEE